MLPEDKLREISDRFAFLEASLGTDLAPDALAKAAKEYSDLKPVVEKIAEFEALNLEVEDASALLSDPEMKALAEEELRGLRQQLSEVEANLMIALIPKDEADERPAILEIRPGTGGDEAALFAADLLKMYQRFSETNGWTFEILEAAETELGGLREGVVSIQGSNVFARLKFESGVHRVQRVPATEAGGRIHTSAATVAVLPEMDEVSIDIPSSDIRIDTMRASGAGGQHVNTTDSAVRITHLPTGIIVTSSEKSQHRNRDMAMQVLRARLFDLEQQKQQQDQAAARKGQVGSGDRSERIRTYNFPQGRVTDHRINLTLYKLDQVIQGDLTEIVDSLIAADQAEKLAELNP